MRYTLLALSLLGALATPASATLVGTIFSSPTSANDPMVVYWNPAAMTLNRGSIGLLHGGFTSVNLDYQRMTPSGFDGSMFPNTPMDRLKPEIAMGFVTDAGTDKFAFGFGYAVPIVDGASWPSIQGGKPSSTRYYAIEAVAAQMIWRVAAAYRINRYISIGAGIDLVGIWLQLDMMFDLGAKINQLSCQINDTECMIDTPVAREDPDFAAPTSVDGWGWGVGAVFSVLVTPTPWLRLGMAVHTGAGGVDVDSEVDIKFPRQIAEMHFRDLGIALQDIHADAEINQHSPLILTAGFSVHPWPQLDLGADIHWVRKSKMTTMFIRMIKSSSSLLQDTVTVKSARDDYYVGVRGTYRFLSRFAAALRVEYNPSMRPEMFITPSSIDYHKIQVLAGLAWDALSWLTVMAEYGHFILMTQHIRESHFAPSANPTTAIEQSFDAPDPIGDYTGFANRFTVAVQVRF